ncbi:MAG: hypothetical protein RL338_61 [Chloroflexota bacterium]
MVRWRTGPGGAHRQAHAAGAARSVWAILPPMRPTTARRPLRSVAPALLACLLVVGAVAPPPAKAIEVEYGAIRLQDSAAVRAVAAALPRTAPLAPASAVDRTFVEEVLGGRDDFYKAGILADGYPGRWVGTRLVAHPIYGAYVLGTYLRRYADAPSDAMAASMLAFANVALARMEPFAGSLVFMNPPELRFLRSPGRRYSGLTMGYYALYLAAIARITGDAGMRSAAEATFRSLLVPEPDGGVLYRLPEGRIAFAEIPGRPADLTLNGWLSILVSIHDYAQLTGDEEAAAVFRTSAGTLAKLLPLYDDRPRRLSRYALSGPLRVRLRVSDPAAVTLADPRAVIPGDASYPLSLGGASSWVNHVEPADAARVGTGSPLRLAPRATRLRMSLVLSRISYPTPNVLRLTVTATRRTTLSLDTWTGVYSPRASSPILPTWRSASSVTVEPGVTTVRLAIPWTLADGVGGITNWTRVMDGKPVNIYHPIHVRRLEEMYEMFAVSRFEKWARIWRADLCAWGSMPAYAGLYTTGEDGRLAAPRSLCP